LAWALRAYRVDTSFCVLRLGTMKCAICKDPLPDIHWKLHLSEPAEDPLHRYCADCYNGPRGKEWMAAWADITKGSANWYLVAGVA